MGSELASYIYGLVVKLTAVADRREEVISVLKESAVDMPGNLSYVVAKDTTDENVIWVTEVWDSATSHDASLSLPSVKHAIPQIKPLISRFEKIAVTSPAWSVGLNRAQPQ